ncbi:maleylpyruvate isomerase N-terminal domain-containing protein [Propioniciclava flava]
MDFASVIAVESRRFAATLRGVAPTAPVPTCPEWSAADLAWHLTEVHGFWARVLTSGALTDEDAEALEASAPARPDDPTEIWPVFERETRALLDALALRDDTEAAWFWLPTACTVGSTRRMQAHEATVHRLDAEAAADVTSAPVDAEVAADAVSHAIEVMWAWWGTNPGFVFVPTTGPVALTALDVDRVWHVQPGRWRGVGSCGTSYDVPGVRLTEEAPAVAQVTATADALMRWLWGRGPEPATSGDAAAVAALREARDQGMQ